MSHLIFFPFRFGFIFIRRDEGRSQARSWTKLKTQRDSQSGLLCLLLLILLLLSLLRQANFVMNSLSTSQFAEGASPLPKRRARSEEKNGNVKKDSKFN
jgi:hypothetical protein